MKYRALGRTGLKVSELGFGSWGIGKGMWGATDDNESFKALELAIEKGINFFDTALIYGDNLNYHSEKMIGKLIAKHPEKEIIVATKIYPKNMKWPAETLIEIDEVFPPEWIRESVEKSLENLGVECIDLMQFHVWQDSYCGDDLWKKTVRELIREGKVKAFGISTNNYEPANCIRALETGLISTVQFIFNIFHQEPEKALLPYARKHSIGLIARVPLDEGGLSGTIMPTTEFYDFRKYYFRGKRKEEVFERVSRLKHYFKEEIASVALRWVMTHPEVSTVIAGMRTRDHVLKNVTAVEKGVLSPDLMRELRRHAWERNFYL